jgi:hypothetical protein
MLFSPRIANKSLIISNDHLSSQISREQLIGQYDLFYLFHKNIVQTTCIMQVSNYIRTCNLQANCKRLITKKMKQMKKVFEPFQLAGITFPNRIIRSATYEGMSDKDGRPTEQLLKKYTALAKGGVGGIITGFIGVNQQGMSTGYYMSMINNAETVKAYKKLTRKMHELGTPIIAQLNHCGGQTKEEDTGMPVIAPSKIPIIRLKK